ncbi:MAG: tRNA lysidine(34) synthetase TilS [Candidatus Accumulibacter sp.]|uniref:tRNA(Ile)-lysidine synthase n=1 Tax=Candidatus Accumulibacter proximus TaxID=2954385 RepID=A0A935UH99_9PROT|nr:tRNA lysidine(34) synthetase TilS [Candidatus Accumulibacter proximus]
MAGSKSGRRAEPAAAAATQQIELTLTAFLEARLHHGARLCVGLSGGRDSVVLLHSLAGLRASGLACELSALHVHHGLSASADAWADFCAESCQRLGVPLEISRVAVPRDSGEGLEAAARRLRHTVFAACPADWLALAHHRDDQAETVLFRLLRGAGVKGAAGMLAERPQAGGPCLIRPLLALRGSVIADYGEAHSLTWIEDESNADLHYRRNHLRREVMPRIEQQFPGAAQALVRAGAHFAEAALLLDELAQADRRAVVGDQGRIDLARFNALSAPRARNLLRSELLAVGFRAPEARWLDEALRQLATASAGSETCVATPDGELHVYRGELHLVRHRPVLAAGAIPWCGEEELPWGAGRVSFRATVGAGIHRRLLAGEPVYLRCRQGGERLQPDPRRPVRTLRKLLQEAAVPPWERSRLPLLWCGERLVWVGGIGSAAAFVCPPGEQGLAVFWQAADGCLPPATSRRPAD